MGRMLPISRLSHTSHSSHSSLRPAILLLRLHRGFSLQLAPANHRAGDRRGDRLKHHVVHHLAIAEALQEEPPEQAPALFALEQKSETGRAPVNREKQRVVKEHLPQVSE